MSLLDDVSIVVTPNGYKAGELYAVIPVPTEGAELVTNGDFAADANWTKGTGWTISGGEAINNGTINAIYQSSSIEIGKKYICKIDITFNSAGIAYWRLGNSSNIGVMSVSGSIEQTLTGSANGTYLGIFTNTAITIDNVSVKEFITASADMDVTRATAATRVDENGLVNYAEVLGGEEVTNGDFATDSNWIKEAGTTISGGSANFVNATAVSLYQNIGTQSGTIKVEFTVNNYTSGILNVYSGGNQSVGTINVSANALGTYTAYVVRTGGNNNIIFGSNNNFTGSIDNVSVKEVTRDNVPRIDYTGGGCPHILAEPQRTNLIK
jgi:hypothetical protein